MHGSLAKTKHAPPYVPAIGLSPRRNILWPSGTGRILETSLKFDFKEIPGKS